MCNSGLLNPQTLIPLKQLGFHSIRIYGLILAKEIIVDSQILKR